MNICASLKNCIQTAKRKRRMKRLGGKFPFSCRLYGAPSALAQSRTGDELQIVQVSVKEHPKNAFVYSIPLNCVLGYLDERASEKLLFSLGAEFCVDGKIQSLDESGCEILVFPTSKLMEGVEDFSHLYGE